MTTANDPYLYEKIIKRMDKIMEKNSTPGPDDLVRQLRDVLGKSVHVDIANEAAARIVALEAEVARIEGEHHRIYEAEFAQIVRPYSAKIDEIKAERDAAIKDAERYRWLRTRNEGSEVDPPGPYVVCYGPDEMMEYPDAIVIDAAIDAARSQKGATE